MINIIIEIDASKKDRKNLEQALNNIRSMELSE